MWELIDEVRFGGRAVRDLMFPRRCLVCGRFLEIEEKYLCIGCYADMPLTYFDKWNENPVEKLLWQKVGITAATSLYFYLDSNFYSLLTQKVKYRGWLDLGTILGKHLGQTILDSGRFKEVDAIVPVPLHWRRKWKRGYNQSEIIAKGVSEIIGKPILNLLIRTKHTVSQTTLDVTGKSQNVTGAFAINRHVFEKTKKQGIKHVLLLDDVLTSGSTIGSCACALIEFFEVSVATVASVGEL